MKQPRSDIVDAIINRLEGHTNPKLMAKEIAAYLLMEGRVADLEPIMRDIMAHRSARGGVVEAEVVSAHELTQAVLDDVKTILKSEYPKAKRIDLDQRQDAEIIGGVKLILPHRQLDHSVRSKLARFKYLVNSERS